MSVNVDDMKDAPDLLLLNESSMLFDQNMEMDPDETTDILKLSTNQTCAANNCININLPHYGST